VRLSLEALQQLRLLGSVADEALCLNNLGDLALIMGDLNHAETYLRDGLALCKQHGIRGTQGLLLANLCFLAGRRGQLDDAIRNGRQALALLQQIGDRTTGVTMQQQLALLELRQGRAAAAREELSASMREAIQIGHPLLQLYGLLVVSDLLVAVDPGAAAAVLDFGQTHPVADAPLREEIAARRAALGATPPVPAWPQDLDLGQAADLIAGEAATAIDRLRQRLRAAI
jgi:tetratricopeptide (TPR) repeat protein